MRIAIGAPGNGQILKDEIRRFLHDDDRVEAVIDLSEPEITYPAVSFLAAEQIPAGQVDRAVVICGTGVGTAIPAKEARSARPATAPELVTARGAVENYDAQILCMGQNVIAAPYARTLIDLWLDLRHDPTGTYGPKLDEIAAFEASDCHFIPLSGVDRNRRPTLKRTRRCDGSRRN